MTIYQHFKRPLRITGIATGIALVICVALGTKIHREKIGDRAKIARVQMMGRGLGLMTALLVAPFWLIAAARVGKVRRAIRDAAQKLKRQTEDASE